MLAACINRAKIEFNDENIFTDSENNLYWYVRERCLELARENQIKFAHVIELSTKDSYTSLKQLVKITEPIWNEVVHPIILVQGVLES